MSPVSAKIDQGGELAHPGQLGQHFDGRVGLGVLVHLLIQAGDAAGQGVDQGQVIVDHLAGGGRQVQAGQIKTSNQAAMIRSRLGQTGAAGSGGTKVK